jgi:NADH:ubiquinone oxidoreductase subunit F (NADH-binding)
MSAGPLTASSRREGRRLARPRVRVVPPALVRAVQGPLLLAGVTDGNGLDAHRHRVGDLPRLRLPALLDQLTTAAVRGRGGAGFPFATKLRTAATRRRPVVVVNGSEGEPASAKDTALLLLAPHRVLDGAQVVAGALGVREVTIVVPEERPATVEAVRRALGERRSAGDPMDWRLHVIEPGFVSGQARAVLESLSGRPALPVTAWEPEAVRGLRGRPTLLSNAETFAHVGAIALDGGRAYAALGTADEPGTTLLTLPDPSPIFEDALREGPPDSALVVEVEHGTPWEQVLGQTVDRPVLLGGFHGTWVPAGSLADATVSRAGLAASGWALGAGVVLPLPEDVCPVVWTSEIVDYLAGQSAGRCGPCHNGLPELAAELGALADASPAASHARIRELAGLVTGRGACAHPDGTARLVRSLLGAAEDEVAAHLVGRCTC